MPVKRVGWRRLGNRALGVLVSGVAIAFASSGAVAGPPAARFAAVPFADPIIAEPVLVEEVTLPTILSPADAALYARIFDLQKRGKWHKADHEIKSIEDPVLMGHVLAQRYLHPTHYRSRYKELRDWLKKYADHPQASQTYKLAKKRMFKNALRPPRPKAPLRYVGVSAAERDKGYVSPRKRTRAQRRKLINLLTHMRRHIRRRDPNGAAKHLDDKALLKVADDAEYDIIRREVAASYFFKGKDERAYELASASAARSGDKVPLTHWTAGLAAFRLGRVVEARDHFEAVAAAENLPAARIAAGAYWAARANLITRRPERVNRLLAIAASHPRNFYGLLANRALGQVPEFSWELPALDAGEVATVMQIPAMRRALALVEAGQSRFAEAELRGLEGGIDPALGKAMLSIASRLNLPAAQYRIARRLRDFHGHYHDGGMYPVPDWRPANGYRVDRALIFALMRQESQFNSRAKSNAGARGLMQLMPRTASFIARDRRYRTSRRNRLYEPEVSIELGQKYVLHLRDAVDGNLLYMVAAYNGGPGNVKKWRRRNHYKDDPLLFVESVPSRETRNFVQIVLTNLWMYRARLGQSAPSLDAVAAGRWPLYVPLDSISVAFDAGN